MGREYSHSLPLQTSLWLHIGHLPRLGRTPSTSHLDTVRQGCVYSASIHLGLTGSLSLLVHTVARARRSVAVEATENDWSFTFTESSVRFRTIWPVFSFRSAALRRYTTHNAKNDSRFAEGYLRRLHDRRCRKHMCLRREKFRAYMRNTCRLELAARTAEKGRAGGGLEVWAACRPVFSISPSRSSCSRQATSKLQHQSKSESLIHLLFKDRHAQTDGRQVTQSGKRIRPEVNLELPQWALMSCHNLYIY